MPPVPNPHPGPGPDPAASPPPADADARPRRSGTQRGVAIQRLTFADLPQVLGIERRSYPAPWSLAMFVLETAEPAGLSVVGRAFGTAIGSPAVLVGYAIVSRYDDAFHVMNVCVEPNRRREGIARSLLEHVIERAGGPDARLTLEVRPSNLGARRLYDDLGFVAVGTRRRYYRDDGEDALIMWRTPATLVGQTYDIPGAEGRGAGAGGPVPPDVPAANGGGRPGQLR